MRDGSLNGSRRRNRSLIKLKIVVFSPMPSARVRIATSVNPGDLWSWRRANLRSFISFGPQRHDWINARRATGWHAAPDQRDSQKRKHCDQHSPGVDGADVV